MNPRDLHAATVTIVNVAVLGILKAAKRISLKSSVKKNYITVVSTCRWDVN